MDIDVNALSEHVSRVLEHLPAAPRKYNIDAVYVSTMISALVKTKLIERSLAGIGQRTGDPGSFCLAPEKVRSELGRGADGVVYMLKSGKVAKVQPLDVSDDSNEAHVSLQMSAIAKEHQMTETAGNMGVSPRLHNSYLCTEGNVAMHVMIMDNVEGMELYDWLDEHTEKGERMEMFDQIAGMVEQLNSAGIYHQDLHAGNVIVDSDNRPHIIDFSRARNNSMLADIDMYHMRRALVRKGEQRTGGHYKTVDNLAVRVAHVLLEEGAITVKG